MRYAVILAGGAGKRLWPMSRLKRPKQLLPLLAGKNLLQLAVERLAGLFQTDHILIVTNAEYVDGVAAALPQLPPENIIGEPVGRDTANAIALASSLLAAKNEGATMAVFTADHVIHPREKFAEAVQAACQAAEDHPDALVTFGIRPTWPHTGLGYVHCGEQFSPGVRRVLGFKEKPNHHIARRYVESGEHFWNSGMFVWTLGAIRSALRKFLPESIDKLEPVRRASKAGERIEDLLAKIYDELPRISIDFAVMEKAHQVLMVELHCEWQDVGSWPAVANAAEPDSEGNAVVAENVIVLDSSRNVIVAEGDHLLAIFGVEDCVVVHTPDATLVCNKADAQRLKELVEMVGKKFGSKYL